MIEKFNSRADRVRNIKETAEKTFKQWFTDYEENPAWYCCVVSIPKDLYSYRFKDPVDFGTMCIRESGFVGPEPTYPEKRMFATFASNQVITPGLKWQYFGTEQGIFSVFPAATSSTCGTYDPRFR